MAGRGRPKKKVEVPETVQELIQRVEPELIEAIPYVDPIVEDEPVSTPNIVWDVTLDTEIKHFDPTLSYELTGYRPVDEERGLDFNPEWFTEARQIKLRNIMTFGTKRLKDVIEDMNHMDIESQVIITSSLIIIG